MPHIVDLGICRKMGEATITQGSGLMGTLQWMSPEQVSRPGSEDQRSDLYALGVIMYYSLTGTSPVKGDEAGAIALSICRDVPPEPRQVLGSIPAPLSHACMGLMAKRPEDRFQTAGAFLKALNGQALKRRRCRELLHFLWCASGSRGQLLPILRRRARHPAASCAMLGLW